MKNVVIIGGGVAAKGFLGAAFALEKDTKFTVIRSNAKGPVPCGIPYAFGTLDDPMKNQSSDKKLLDNGVDLVIDDVIKIDRDHKKVATASGKAYPYDQLVLATGSHPVFPPFPGKDLEGIHVIEKDLDKIAALRPVVEEAKSIVIVGGGFIGVELADEINKLTGKEITLIELAPHVLSVAFESHYSSQIEASLSKHGIKVRTGVGVQAFKGQRMVDTVVLSSGEEIKADIVFMAIGAFPNIDLALDCKLDLDARKAVKVNKYQQTSDPYIFAIGDCASKLDIFTGAESNVRLASIAAKEGRNAALNLSIQNAPLSVLGITNLFSTVIDGTYYAAAGMTKAQIEASPFRAIEVHLSAANKHPATLPGTVMTEGVFYFAADTLTLLGAQLSGDKEIAETINAIGIAIQNNATAHDLYSYLYGTQPMGTASPNMYILHQAGLKALSSKELL